jgi:hypothetical protein
MKGTLSFAETLKRGDIVTVIMPSNELQQGWIHKIDLPIVHVGLPDTNSWFFNILSNPNYKVGLTKCFEVPKTTIITHVENILPGIHRELIEL